ncbi:LTA synthase family protein [Halomonas lysinitropha]|uniref:Sulfatase n=1 Tax=Halomonas lysinitropha TaxID=2607506 RepID=A0A5K1I9K3_9GAMM|nr:LTA synthase family protein [Halomonas lysinitropha]VVZ95762.1 Sulfatase [Halomonas lysinitropha]
MIAALWPPLAAGLALTLVIEGLLRPAVTPFWRRHWATLAVHIGSWVLLFTLFLLVLQRPWFAVVFIASLQLVVVQSSNIKAATLREPFICQDFEYFLDAIRHPRLYVPFFGIGLAIAASTAGALAIAALLWLEPSLAARQSAIVFLQAIALLLSGALAAIGLGLPRLPPCRLEPQEDLAHLGLFAALWAYGLRARRPLDVSRLDSPFAAPAPAALDPQRLPHVVAVQSESFFDPRRWRHELPGEPLMTFDALKRQALAHGQLQVPAWGANTVRTECAFLTGLPPRALGIHRFNPYHQLARRGIPSLASHLGALGYRTVCVHPYPASFYARDRVMPRLGFEEFLDIRAFDPARRDGQYIADAAVAEKVGSLLDDGDNRPLFVFVITMENHGPLHLERPVPRDAPPLEATIPGDTADLRIYLRHLSNADSMLASLQQQLTPRDRHARQGLLCWYGDHVPIMADLYRRLGAPDGRTDYLIWSSSQGASPAAAAEELEVAGLGQHLLGYLAETTRHAQASGGTHDAAGHHQEQE